jgi:hypothetical protein
MKYNKYAKKPKKSIVKPKFTKRVQTAIKNIVKKSMDKQIETKTINVPDTSSLGVSNTRNLVYGALSGLQYLCYDIFKVSQGVLNSTQIGAANRIGDKIHAKGFEMNYMFHTRNNYTVGPANYVLPFVKLRVIVFRTNSLTSALSQQQLLDISYLAGDTSVLQPIDWNEGYLREVLYDKTYVIRSQSVNIATAGSIPNAPFPYGNCIHFKKYIKYDKVINANDSNSSSPLSSDKLISIAILAEVDDSNTGLVPSGTSLLYTTGYTRAFFQDA